MTVITVSTVGYGYLKAENPTPEGKVLIICLIFFGVGTIGYGVHTMSAFIIEGELRRFFRRSRMEKKIAKLRDHYVVCGLGRTGRTVVEQLQHAKVPFVAVDHSEHTLSRAKDPESILFIRGNATEDAVLESCGVEHARGLLACLDSDADNLFIVLSARQKNARLRIIARASDESTGRKMLKAGADHVVAPAELGALRMASAVLRPHVVSFLDVVTRTGDSPLSLEQVTLSASCSLCGQTLRQAELPQKAGVIVIGLLRGGGRDVTYNPTSDTLLSSGDTLIVLGHEDQMKKLMEIVLG
jgi:voltage-gated potassium channel